MRDLKAVENIPVRTAIHIIMLNQRVAIQHVGGNILYVLMVQRVIGADADRKSDRSDLLINKTEGVKLLLLNALIACPHANKADIRLPVGN